MGLNKPIVYSGGTFDLFHAGHVAFLKRCSRDWRGGCGPQHR
jgi:glycerol-3-phosphate cytidylyltransferase-like family protein